MGGILTVGSTFSFEESLKTAFLLLFIILRLCPLDFPLPRAIFASPATLGTDTERAASVSGSILDDFLRHWL